MAVEAALDRRHAAALHGVQDDDHRPVDAGRQRPAHRREVVPVRLADLDVEARERPADRVERGDLARRAEALEPVVVDQDRQVGEPLVGRENHRLEGRALLPFAVGGQAEDPPRPALQPGREGEPGGEREAVPEAAGAEAASRQAAGRGVPGQPGAVAVEGVELGIRDQPAAPQGDVERTRRVALREDEAVRLAQHLVMDEHHRVERRQVAAEMPDIGVPVHGEQPPARQRQEARRQQTGLRRGRRRRCDGPGRPAFRPKGLSVPCHPPRSRCSPDDGTTAMVSVPLSGPLGAGGSGAMRGFTVRVADNAAGDRPGSRRPVPTSIPRPRLSSPDGREVTDP